MSVPAILISPPSLPLPSPPPEPPATARTSLVDKVTIRAMGTLGAIRRRPVSTISVNTISSSSSRRRSSTFGNASGDALRSTSDSVATNTSSSHLSERDAYARPLPRRGRHTICSPLPILPPLQLGTPFGKRIHDDGAPRRVSVDELQRLDFLNLISLFPEIKRLPYESRGPPSEQKRKRPSSEIIYAIVPPEPVHLPSASITTEVPEDASAGPSQDSSESHYSALSTSLDNHSEPCSPVSVALITPTPDSRPPSPLPHPPMVMSIRSMHKVRRKPIQRNILSMLDSAVHSAIIENVLLHVPPGQFASLRKVCIDFRDWVDRFLRYHVTIETYGMQEASHITFTITSLNGMHKEKVGTTLIWRKEPIETLSCSLLPARILARTRCVELRGPLGRTDVSQLAEGLLNLQTVRLCENGLGLFPDSCPFVAENIVATLNHDPRERRLGAVVDDARWQLPDGVKRLLLNIRFDGVYPNGRIRPFSYPSSLNEINIRFVGHLPLELQNSLYLVRPCDLILQRTGPLREDLKYAFIDAINFKALWAIRPPLKESSGVFDRAIGKLKSVRRKKSAAIQHFPHGPPKNRPPLPAAMHNAERSSAEEALRAILREAVKKNQKTWKTIDPDTFVNRMAALSLDEYRRHIAPEQFVMETIG